ncbi:E3 ubiquitin-protein ligase RNF6 [Sphaerodactylus townsendi]|uniref:E3 ubiquitin-protein ligase RNF6 n=1 Tax=Sphaerodactylus townsendi TaxID=933632 RepID=UPI0020267602|nr:E3 ubiquitin-protein ligase RNF6 [Sphaerodactylus townsendi]XP_048350873.1 E3 ubiquitin-protein ligase RNF6 [Sphaerodactylus townsendi]XP_048350874.1 E3 ubiquitin-protein ligase RNF6 [Sphaerodactylus townsendi]
MNSSGSGSKKSGRQTTFQNPSGEDERQRQQERLCREEAYYQFINELSDEDYRLMRDYNLLGTPGEITADDLQRHLQEAKEDLVSQSNTKNREGDTVRDSETLGLNSTSDSLPEWLNSLRHTGNSSHSEQRGNQTWGVVSQVNPTHRGFQFINVNHEHNGGNGPNEESEGISHGFTIQSHAENTPPIADSQIVSQTRNRVLRKTFGHTIAFSSSGSRSGLVVQNGEELPRFFSASSATNNPFLDDNEHIIRQRRVHRDASMRLQRVRTWRKTRQRSKVLRSQSQILLEGWQLSDTQQIQTRSGRTHTVHSPPHDEAPSDEAPSLDIIVEEEASGMFTTILERHPGVTLNLPEAYSDQPRIVNRIHSRADMAENSVAAESNSGGFSLTISQPEHTGRQTDDSTTYTLPGSVSLISLVLLRSIISQVITVLQDVSSLIDIGSHHAMQMGLHQLSEMRSVLSNLQSLINIGQFRETSLGSSLAEQGSGEWDRESSAAQHGSDDDETQDSSRFRDANNLTGDGTHPILRLVPHFLSDYHTSDHLRGLTEGQMDSLFTHNYGATTAVEGEINKTCTICMNEYVLGNKLRQLPCKHEFHVHCIDRWLSENSTCPICRQSVVM